MGNPGGKYDIYGIKVSKKEKGERGGRAIGEEIMTKKFPNHR
jgi:hypothetical protein